jgi:SAM-dependent methyltransferase
MLSIRNFSSEILVVSSDTPQFFWLTINDGPPERLECRVSFANLSTSFHAVRFFDPALADGDQVRLRPDAPLEAQQTPVTLVFRSSHNDAALTSSAVMTLPDWAVDHVDIEGSVATMRGWILPSSSHTQINVTANGRIANFGRLSETTRDDLQNVFGHFSPFTAPLDFVAHAHVDLGSEFLRLSLTENGQASGMRSIYFPVKASRHPVPEGNRILRVYGVDRPKAFLIAGATSYQRITQLVERYYPLRSTRKLRILDWGCGCAGVGRYFLNDSAYEYRGIDIDVDNVEYCKSTVCADEGIFGSCDLMPPTRFADASFDIIFGISVVTHLSEETQFAWLSELRRLIRPHGILILTVLGLQAAAKAKILSETSIRKDGFLFTSGPSPIGDVIGSQDYYGTTLHMPDYVFSKWQGAFEIIEYLASGWSHQDVVVLRPRETS